MVHFAPDVGTQPNLTICARQDVYINCYELRYFAYRSALPAADGAIHGKTTEGVVKEKVFFSGTIIGEGHRVDCKVRATKTTLDLDPDTPPDFSDYDIIDSAATVRLPDGDYGVLSNGFKLRCKLNRGRFLWRQ